MFSKIKMTLTISCYAWLYAQVLVITIINGYTMRKRVLFYSKGFEVTPVQQILKMWSTIEMCSVLG